MDPIAAPLLLAAPPTLDGAPLSSAVTQRWQAFIAPLRADLTGHVDRRLLRTLVQIGPTLLRHRHRPQALLLSELGGVLAGPQHAPAGTKRLANLLHSPRWTADALDAFLLARGRERVEAEAARVPEGRALCILDGSVLEKPESACLEGLSPVRSQKARRLARPRRTQLGPGYYRGTPGGPIVVPGYAWLGVLVTGWAATSDRRPVGLGAWYWYAQPRKGAAATNELPAVPAPTSLPQQGVIPAELAVLERVTAAWGSEHLLHVWDRGFSGEPWLGRALDRGWHCVVRWKKGHRLRPATAPSVGDPMATAEAEDRDGVPAWRLTVGLRAWGQRLVANPRHPEQPVRVSFAARPVRLLHREEPLWLVVVRLHRSHRRRQGAEEPWRLVTTERVESEAACWRVVEAYAARWAIEQMLRFSKSELGAESLRVRTWAAAHKLLGLVGVAYAFLVELLGDGRAAIVAAVLHWAHRTGRQARDAWRSLYRLRAGLAALWLWHPPCFADGP